MPMFSKGMCFRRSTPVSGVSFPSPTDFRSFKISSEFISIDRKNLNTLAVERLCLTCPTAAGRLNFFANNYGKPSGANHHNWCDRRQRSDFCAEGVDIAGGRRACGPRAPGGHGNGAAAICGGGGDPLGGL